MTEPRTLLAWFLAGCTRVLHTGYDPPGQALPALPVFTKPNAKRGHPVGAPAASSPVANQQSLIAPVVKLMLLPLCGVPMGAMQAPSAMLASPAHV